MAIFSVNKVQPFAGGLSFLLGAFLAYFLFLYLNDYGTINLPDCFLITDILRTSLVFFLIYEAALYLIALAVGFKYRSSVKGLWLFGSLPGIVVTIISLIFYHYC